MSQMSSLAKESVESVMELSTTAERREHRRHDLETQEITVDRWEGGRRSGKNFGKIVDISAGGLRIRTNQPNVQPDHQIRLRMELPAYAGISPFVTRASGISPKTEWTGWMSVARVAKVSKDQYDVCGRLMDMDEIDRGMLGLYLSTQPLAA
ncbi:MAG: PilZ domain-containing protein [Tepidisphaeraceae bacterium]